jgi:GNAT superfamily N-acetyltransferase
LADKVFLLAEGWNQECQRYLFLKTLITHPKHRRMGYAKEMLKIVKEVAHEDGFHDEIILVPAACEWITQPEQIDWSREVTPLQVHDGTHPCPNAPLTDKQLENIYLNEGWRPNVVNHLFVIENSAFGNQSLSECPISEYGKRKGRRILAWRADFDRE